MLAVFFTKPPQGSAFRRMRSKILNMPFTDTTASEVHRSVLNKSKNDDKKQRDGQRAVK